MSEFERIGSSDGEVDPTVFEVQQEDLPELSMAQILRTARYMYEYDRDEDDDRTDWERMRDFADELENELDNSGLTDVQVAIRYNPLYDIGDGDIVEVVQEDATLIGFTTYHSPTQFDNGGEVAEGQRYELGVEIQPNSSKDKTKIIPINDPMLCVELPDNERQHLATAVWSEAVNNKLLNRSNLEKLNLLTEYLYSDFMQDTSVREIAEIAAKIVNSRKYQRHPSLQMDVEQLLHRSFPRDRYKFDQKSAYYFHEKVNEEEQTVGAVFQPLAKHNREHIDGTLVGIAFLPRYRDKKKAMIPYFLIEETVKDGFVVAPLEDTMYMRRVDEA
jgi:hypothetical protein